MSGCPLRVKRDHWPPEDLGHPQIDLRAASVRVQLMVVHASYCDGSRFRLSVTVKLWNETTHTRVPSEAEEYAARAGTTTRDSRECP
jgi:hypothetical protein